MKWLTIEDIKKQLRIEPGFTDEDMLLESYGEAAEETLLNYLNRPYLDIIEHYGKVPLPLVQASLMLVDVSYQHRSPVSVTNISLVPYTFDLLVKPYMRLASATDGDVQTVTLGSDVKIAFTADLPDELLLKDVDFSGKVYNSMKKDVEKKVTFLREKHGFTEFAGDNVEYHASGCLTFPLLGTKAVQKDKLAIDPDRKKRRAFYPEVCDLFSDYNVFVGGSSSFDMAPAPYNKAYALAEYCKEHGIAHDEVAYVGDDYGPGGNDESVYLSDFPYLTIDDYRMFPEIVSPLL